jgi:hypothetical protein
MRKQPKELKRRDNNSKLIICAIREIMQTLILGRVSLEVGTHTFRLMVGAPWAPSLTRTIKAESATSEPSLPNAPPVGSTSVARKPK